ncbi:alpha/beta fold hydrolase [bacterium]|nr:alpha/beta fold hydrolase [bacterium]
MQTIKYFIILISFILTTPVSTLRGEITQPHSLSAEIPWDLSALSKAPNYRWENQSGKHYALTYKALPYQDIPQTTVFAYYSTPGILENDRSLDTNLPAIVLVHGGGGKAFAKWVELWAGYGYAAIAMDLAGCGPDKTPLKNGGPGQKDTTKFGNIDQPIKNQWTYHAVANVILAHSLIRSFPEVDKNRTAITGISWGGYLTCIVAGLDNRFQAAVPVYGCGFLHENSTWLDWFEKKFTKEQSRKWVKLWDPSQYVGAAAMPMLFVNGGKDFAYHPSSHAKTYALVKSKKNLRFTPELPHGHIFDKPKEIKRFIDSHLKDGTPLPKIVSVKTNGQTILAIVKSPTQLQSASLHYTTDPLRMNNRNREWITLPAKRKGKQIHAKLLDKPITIWFLTVTDTQDARVSSPLQFPQGKQGSPSAKLHHITDGNDWSLPPTITPTPNTGFGWINQDWLDRWTDLYPIPNDNNIYFSQYIFFNWAEINPKPGVYHWESIDQEIERITSTPGLGFALWPRVYSRSSTPDRKLHGTGKYEGNPVVPRWLEEQDKIHYMPDGLIMIWEPETGYFDALREFLLALGERYKNHPAFTWVDCRYLGPHWGEGGFRAGKAEVKRAEREHGLTPERLTQGLLRYIDIWAEAFAGQEHKVVLSNWEPALPGFPPEYDVHTKQVRQHALKQGLGGRDGQVEVWYRYMTEGYGIRVEKNGYLQLNEDYPPIKENRVWFTENENYYTGGDNWDAKFGPDILVDYRWFASNLRLLQMRRNWSLLFFKEEGIDGGWAALQWPKLTRYVQLSMGKTAKTSPDGWCWLREGYMNLPNRGRTAIKNFERWLVQRDMDPNGRTQPAVKVDITHMGQWATPYNHEYQARRTDLEKGQDAIYFQAARHWFGAQSQSTRLFLTYLDGPQSTWHIEYNTPEGHQFTPGITTQNSGEWKTACFTIPNMACNGHFPNKMDFRLRVTEGYNATIRMARLVKWPIKES